MNEVISPGARDDITQQFRWYLIEQDAADVAFRFVEAVEKSVQQLLLMPHMGARIELKKSALAGLRSWPVKGFEDIHIFYVAQVETIRVIRILHGKRDIKRILKKGSPLMARPRTHNLWWKRFSIGV